MRDANVRLKGRILYLAEDPGFVRAQLAGMNEAETLNLFGYTGLGSLALSRYGKVTHVDASKKSVAQARENYRLMHSQARAAGIEVFLATEVTFSIGDGFFDSIIASIGKMRGKRDYKEIVNEQVKAVNVWLRQYAGEQKLKLFDFERAVDSGNGSRREEFDQEDGSHINATGYGALTRYATEQLR